MFNANDDVVQNRSIQRSQTSMSIPRSGIQRQTLPGQNQLFVLVCDCSGSMSGDKSVAASQAMRSLSGKLSSTRIRDAFQGAVVAFAGSATVLHDFTPTNELRAMLESPLGIRPGGTNLTAAIELTTEKIAARCADLHRPVVLMFTDGMHNAGPDPRESARSLKEKAVFVTVAFGDDADESLLRDLATSPEHFYRCRDGAELIAFFAAVGQSMSVSLARHFDAAQGLNQVQFAPDHKRQ